MHLDLPRTPPYHIMLLQCLASPESRIFSLNCSLGNQIILDCVKRRQYISLSHEPISLIFCLLEACSTQQETIWLGKKYRYILRNIHRT